ncbi:gliding motility-associated C-terminal domain-containing protein [Hymenobacter busanensis]|uniref:T9SS type B sorting domain-containing protein n=1 Tax=Hymenobacter busanensis TaxID=2607656 RepID=UPI001366DEC0|nr:gliding motility-associated C-terminal domain-containing protein [Hymenobacter busanensis]QHJ05920.1 hypothetical protein GUY19_00870 [Hymenobacter busanensis]
MITPNGDGRNDRFAPHGLVGTGWNLVVLNRWGKQVYRCDDYRNDWGAEASAGVYYFMLRNTRLGAKYKGTVEVIR